MIHQKLEYFVKFYFTKPDDFELWDFQRKLNGKAAAMGRYYREGRNNIYFSFGPFSDSKTAEEFSNFAVHLANKSNIKLKDW